MAGELTEAWVEQAIAFHRRHEQRQAAFDALVRVTEVSIRSPDQLVEVRVGADGTVRGVDVVGPLAGRTTVEVSRSIDAALGATADAAAWARRTLYAAVSGAGQPGG